MFMFAITVGPNVKRYVLKVLINGYKFYHLQLCAKLKFFSLVLQNLVVDNSFVKVLR